MQGIGFIDGLWLPRRQSV